MQATLISKDGVVYLHDLDSGMDMVALTATEALWLSFFLQQHLQSEFILQLRLAAQHANLPITDAISLKKEYPLKRS